MTQFYADSSVLVKRHVMESGSVWVQQVCSPNQNNDIITSRLSTVEVISALNRRRRESSISLEDYVTLRDDFLALCRQQYRLVAITTPVLRLSRDLLERYSMRAYDALHVASALVVNEQLVAAGLQSLTLLAADGRLLAAAQAEGLVVINPQDHV